MALHLGAVVLEPELEVLRLEFREALAIGRPVQLVCELFDDVGGRMGVLAEPPLQLWNLRQRIDEDSAPLLLVPRGRRCLVRQTQLGQ